MFSINMRADLSGMQRAIADLGSKHVPFASAVALNRLAKGVVDAERQEIDHTFDSPTPFTENAFRMEVATKARPRAIVMAKDIQAQYLEPYISGHDRWLGGKRGMIVPRGIAVNQYGNLPRNKLKQLLGRRDVFIGKVKFKKSGEVVSGIWQRPATGKRRAGDKGTKGKTNNSIGGVRTGLKLLIAFDDSTPAPKSFKFKERAAAYVAMKARAEFSTALAQAVRSARR